MSSVRIKICGITCEEDCDAAVSLGVDAVGLNFYSESPRFISQAKAAMVLRSLPPFVEAVGIFVNGQLPEWVERVRAIGRISSIQWHGETKIPGDPHPFRLIPAFSVQNRQDLAEIQRFLDLCGESFQMPDAVLVDAHDPKQYGGTGQLAPWDLLADFQPGIPVILAGGLTPDNVAEAIHIVSPYAVDVASGVEIHPGRKDPEKMRRFIEQARNAGA